MDIQRPLYWHQGLFLQPQHFQLLDLFIQSLLTPFRQFMAPHFWGIGRIEIQRAGLGNRSFSPLAGESPLPGRNLHGLSRKCPDGGPIL